MAKLKLTPVFLVPGARPCPGFWGDGDWLLASPLTQPPSGYFSPTIVACVRSFGWRWHLRPTGFEHDGLVIMLNLKRMLSAVAQVYLEDNRALLMSNISAHCAAVMPSLCFGGNEN